MYVYNILKYRYNLCNYNYIIVYTAPMSRNPQISFQHFVDVLKLTIIDNWGYEFGGTIDSSHSISFVKLGLDKLITCMNKSLINIGLLIIVYIWPITISQRPSTMKTIKSSHLRTTSM